MKIRIGCVDGHTYESMDFSLEQLQEEIDSKSGAIWTGDYSNRRTYDATKFLEELADFAQYDRRNNCQVLTLTMDGGQERKFNVQHIVWWEIVK